MPGAPTLTCQHYGSGVAGGRDECGAPPGKEKVEAGAVPAALLVGLGLPALGAAVLLAILMLGTACWVIIFGRARFAAGHPDCVRLPAVAMAVVIIRGQGRPPACRFAGYGGIGR